MTTNTQFVEAFKDQILAEAKPIRTLAALDNAEYVWHHMRHTLRAMDAITSDQCIWLGYWIDDILQDIYDAIQQVGEG